MGYPWFAAHQVDCESLTRLIVVNFSFSVRYLHTLHYTIADVIIQSVSTDPQNFTIAISKPNSSSRTDVVTTAVNTTDDSYIYMPSSDLKPGDGYRISFTSSDGGILAQSDEFSITDGTS